MCMLLSFNRFSYQMKKAIRPRVCYADCGIQLHGGAAALLTDQPLVSYFSLRLK